MNAVELKMVSEIHKAVKSTVDQRDELLVQNKALCEQNAVLVYGLCSLLGCSPNSSPEELLSMFEQFITNARIKTWTRNGDVLTCDYLNRLGERCTKTSLIAKDETEEDAKVRIVCS